MDLALRFSRAIDQLNTFFGWIADWLVLFSSLICAFNAMRRYAFAESSNAWLEIQWYMFAGIVLLGASYTLKTNNHVRVDIIYSIVKPHAAVDRPLRARVLPDARNVRARLHVVAVLPAILRER